jgi:hypothetical protein
MGKLEPAALAQHAVAVVVRLEDAVWCLRRKAMTTLHQLDPAALAQHADAVVARLEDSSKSVRKCALETLGKLEPAALAQHANAVVACSEDSSLGARIAALRTLRKLPRFVTHGIDSKLLSDSLELDNLAAARGVQPEEVVKEQPERLVFAPDASSALRSRLLGRLAWYRCRLRLRVERLALYWYALPYRPSGPGHARDVEAWGQMNKRSRQI